MICSLVGDQLELKFNTKMDRKQVQYFEHRDNMIKFASKCQDPSCSILFFSEPFLVILYILHAAESYSNPGEILQMSE